MGVTRGLRYDWEDPSVLHINKLKTHAPLRSHSTFLSAVKYCVARKNPWEQYSGGIIMLSNCKWKFKVFQNPLQVPSTFSNSEFDTSSWDEVRMSIGICYPVSKMPWIAFNSSCWVFVSCTDLGTLQLGMCWLWDSHLHKFCVPYSFESTLCSPWQPNWLLHPHLWRRCSCHSR
jgi:hypothetical protein